MYDLNIFNAAILADDGVFADHIERVSPARREKIARLKRREDKNRSLAAALALDAGLRKLGLREADMRYGTGEHGKPFFIGFPGLHFNMSHSGTVGAAVISNRPVGCDVESHREDGLKIARRFFCPEETEYITSQPDKDAAFLRIWTLKESFVKAIGTGLKTPFDSFRISLDGGISVIRDETDGRFDFHEHSYGEYLIAVCEIL